MKVFITGGTGYVGSRIVRDLLDAGHEVVALVRDGSKSKLPVDPDRIEIVRGDALIPESFSKAIEDCDAVIHLIAIIREFPRKGITFEKLNLETTRNVLNEAVKHDITRFVYMSALGAKHDSPSGYFTTKARSEDLVRDSGLEYSIFRPSIIHGPGDEFINYFAGIMRTFHVIPIIGAGTYRMQPIHLRNVSQAFVQSLTSEVAVNKTYEVAGPDRYQYRDMMQKIKEAAGAWAIPMYQPKSLMVMLAKVLQYFAFFPVTEAQIIMLYDENITDDERIWEDFDFKPIGFEEGLREYL